MLNIDDIKVGHRLREVDQDKVNEIASSIAARGLIHPIKLLKIGNSRPRLSAGNHRLHALRKLGSTELKENVHYQLIDVSGLSPRRALYLSRMIEVHENLKRKGLGDGDYRTHQLEDQRLAALDMAQEKREELVERAKAKAEAEAAERQARKDLKAGKISEEEFATIHRARVSAGEGVGATQKKLAGLSVLSRSNNPAKLPNGLLDRTINLAGGDVTDEERKRLKRGARKTNTDVRKLGPYLTWKELLTFPLYPAINNATGQIDALVKLADGYPDAMRKWVAENKTRKGAMPTEALKQAKADANKSGDNEHTALKELIDEVRKAKQALDRSRVITKTLAKSAYTTAKTQAVREAAKIEALVNSLMEMNSRLSDALRTVDKERK